METIPYDYLAKRLHANRLSLAARCHSPLTSRAEMHACANMLLQDFLSEVQKKQKDSGEKNFHCPPIQAISARDMIVSLPALDKARITNGRCGNPINESAFAFTYQDSTSGSTGQPFDVYRSAHSIQRESIRLWHTLFYYGIDPIKPPPLRVVYLSHYPHATAYDYLDQTLWPLRTTKIPFGDDPKALSLTNSDGFFILSGTPSSHMAALNVAPDFPNRRPLLALSSGESLPTEVRRKMIKHYNCSVANLYVMREFGLLGFECKCGGGIHLFETDFLFASSSEKEILITDTTNSIEHYINYATGDHGELKRNNRSCDCGSYLPLLINFSGRSYGKSISPPSA